MATVTWRGSALAVAQESHATPANVEAGDTFTLTVGSKSIRFTATEATVANVTAGLTAAWNASTAAEIAEIMATDMGTHVQLTGNTAGKPFTVTSSTTNEATSDMATEVLTITTPMAASGPNHWDTAANWSGGAVPVTGDDVVIENNAVSILYGLDQSAVTLSSLTIRKNYTGTIGLPNTAGRDATSIARTVTGGTTTYAEYRPQYLAIGATAVTIGDGTGTGSTRIKLDTGAEQTVIAIQSTGTRAEPSLGAVIWKGTHAGNTIDIKKGSLSVAPFAGETATITTLRIAYDTAIATDAEVDCGSGTYYWESSGTVTDLYIGGSGTLDCRADNRSRTATNAAVYEGAIIHDPTKTVTWTNGIDLVRCGLRDVTLDIGNHLTLTPSAIA